MSKFIDLGNTDGDWENYDDDQRRELEAQRRDIAARYLGYLDYLDMVQQQTFEDEQPSEVPLRLPQTGNANDGRAA